MNCPRCHANSQVLNSRQEGETRWRRHVCKECAHRFTTYEIPAELYDKVLAVSVDAGQFDHVIAFLRNLKVQFGERNGTTKD